MENQIETSKFIPEKAKQIALARLDLVHKWLEFRRKSNIKIQADYDFVKLQQYDGFAFASSFGQSLPRLASSLNAMLDGSGRLRKNFFRNTDIPKSVSSEPLWPTKKSKSLWACCCTRIDFSIGKATALTKWQIKKEQGQDFIPADATFRRYAKWFKANNYDKWVLARDGEKALSDKVEPYIKRDASL